MAVRGQVSDRDLQKYYEQLPEDREASVAIAHAR